MSVVRRRKDAIDALEHALRGVQTHDPQRIDARDRDPGLIGKSSEARVRFLDDTPVEHEVIVKVGTRRRVRRR
jgi:hypothetical protein